MVEVHWKILGCNLMTGSAPTAQLFLNSAPLIRVASSFWDYVHPSLCVMCHVSCVTCHLSRVIHHMYFSFIFFILKNLDIVVELFGGGSVINGAYPIYFRPNSIIFITETKPPAFKNLPSKLRNQNGNLFFIMAKSRKPFSLPLKRPKICNFWGLKAV